MKYRRLGKSGLKVSELSLGAWVTFGSQISDDVAEACMTAAYDAGGNFFDNAEAYATGQAEITMGKILAKTGWDRESLVLSSKVIMYKDKPNRKGLSKKHMVEACNASLKRLQVDYLDLFFCHRPDPETPLEETVRTMHELILRGKILYWGTSEFTGQQIMEAHSIARQYNLTPPTMDQPMYNLFNREKVEKQLFPLYDTIGLGMTTYSPLARGVLTGKYNDGIPEGSRAAQKDMGWIADHIKSDAGQRQIQAVKQLTALADEIGIPLPRLALAWCLSKEKISTVITGASRPEHVRQNMLATNDADKLTPDLITKIEELADAAK